MEDVLKAQQEHLLTVRQYNHLEEMETMEMEEIME
jgi:hypothetical protein